MRFTDVIIRPPVWSGEYYGQRPKQAALDQLVCSTFCRFHWGRVDSIGWFCCILLRRYAEIKENLVAARYPNEAQRIEGWIQQMNVRSVGRTFMHPRVGRNRLGNYFIKMLLNLSENLAKIIICHSMVNIDYWPLVHCLINIGAYDYWIMFKPSYDRPNGIVQSTANSPSLRSLAVLRASVPVSTFQSAVTFVLSSAPHAKMPAAVLESWVYPLNSPPE